MHDNLKEYLEGLIVDHGVTDLDSLGEHEISKINEFLDIKEDLMNDDGFLSLMVTTDWVKFEPCSVSTKMFMIITPIIIAQISDLFDELLAANLPEDNSHEDAEREAQFKDSWNVFTQTIYEGLKRPE